MGRSLAVGKKKRFTDDISTSPIPARSAGPTPQRSKEVLQGCRSPRLGLFELLLMCQAIGSPRHGLKPFLVDRLAVSQTVAERPVFDSLQSVLHLAQHRPIGIYFPELLFLPFVVDAFVAGVTGGVINRFTRGCTRSFHT
jgi:hypothetical protein